MDRAFTQNEKKALFTINSSSAIRFPIKEGKKLSKIKTAASKASLLLQLRAGGHPLGDFHSAEYVIVNSGGRSTHAGARTLDCLRRTPHPLRSQVHRSSPQS